MEKKHLRKNIKIMTLVCMVLSLFFTIIHNQVFGYSADDLSVTYSPVFQQHLSETMQNLTGDGISDDNSDKVVLSGNNAVGNPSIDGVSSSQATCQGSCDDTCYCYPTQSGHTCKGTCEGGTCEGTCSGDSTCSSTCGSQYTCDSVCDHNRNAAQEIGESLEFSEEGEEEKEKALWKTGIFTLR
jgi:hypothetical protein